MFWLKFSLLVLSIFQLSTNVLADSGNLTEAQTALNSLYDHIQASSRLVSFSIYELWDNFTKSIPEVTEELLRNETEKINFVLSNITIFVNNVVGGEDCFDFFLNPATIADPTVNENLTFSNLHNIAAKEISSIANQYTALNNEFTTNCLEDSINCNGTSKAVLAEVERLLPNVNRIPPLLLSEVDILRYSVLINLESARTNLREQYNKAIQNATTCLAAKIRNSKQDKTLSTSKISMDSNESVILSYEDLVITVALANGTSAVNLDLQVVDIALQYVDYMTDTIELLNSALSQVNRTIYSLNNIVQDLNTTVDCSLPDIISVFNDALQNFYLNSFLQNLDILQILNDKATKSIFRAADEIQSIETEITDCSAAVECDYILEKIASKKVEIPWRIQKIENSTTILFQQLVVANTESGSRTVRLALEQAEIGILDLKSCIQHSLQ